MAAAGPRGTQVHDLCLGAEGTNGVTRLNRRQCEIEVTGYYRQKLKEFGPTAQGADWTSDSAQLDRFEALTHSLRSDTRILDFGCGAGDLYRFLSAKGHIGSYQGFDILEEAVAIASSRYGSHFTGDLGQLVTADHVIASGLFNVKGSASSTDWQDYIGELLATMTSLATKSVRFNMLPPVPTVERPRKDLYFVDLNWLFDLGRELKWQELRLRPHGQLFDISFEAWI